MAKRWTCGVLALLLAAGPTLAQAPPFGPGPHAPGPPAPGPEPYSPFPVATSELFPPPVGRDPYFTPRALKKGQDVPKFEPKNPFEYNDTRPNAFGEDLPIGYGCGYYAMVGGMALWRTGMGGQFIAGRDPVGNHDDNTRALPSSLPQILNMNAVVPNVNWGVRGTIGYRYETDAVEVTGYYMFRNDSFAVAADKGRVDLPFSAFIGPNQNPGAQSLLGFQNTQGLWLQADLADVRLQTELASVEANYRWGGGYGAELILGIRYLDENELLSIRTDDDSLTLGAPQPFSAATYSLHTYNRILGPQLGCELENLFVPWLAFGVFGKGCWGANFSQTFAMLRRDDGFISPTVNGSRSQVLFSHFYEGGAFFDCLFFERMRLRFGYQFLLLLNVPEAHAQLNYDLIHFPLGAANNDGHIFFHGPMIEMNIAF